MHQAEYPHFLVLREKLRGDALKVLARTDSPFIKAAQKMITPHGGDLNAPEKLNPLLSGQFPGAWRDLISLTFDMELCLEKVLWARDYLGILPARKDQLELGAWVCCHVDFWLLQIVATLERVDKLATRIPRILLRGRDSQWQKKETALRKPIREMKRHFEKVRNRTAHGQSPLVTEIDYLWEIGLATDPPDFSFAHAMFRSGWDSADFWEHYVNANTTNVMASIEDIFQALVSMIPERDNP